LKRQPRGGKSRISTEQYARASRTAGSSPWMHVGCSSVYRPIAIFEAAESRPLARIVVCHGQSGPMVKHFTQRKIPVRTGAHPKGNVSQPGGSRPSVYLLSIQNLARRRADGVQQGPRIWQLRYGTNRFQLACPVRRRARARLVQNGRSSSRLYVSMRAAIARKVSKD